MSEGNFCDQCQISHAPGEHVTHVSREHVALEGSARFEEEIISTVFNGTAEQVREEIDQIKRTNPGYDFTSAFQRCLVTSLIAGRHKTEYRVRTLAKREGVVLDYRSPEVRAAYKQRISRLLSEGSISIVNPLWEEIGERLSQEDLVESCVDAYVHSLRLGNIDIVRLIEVFCKAHKIKIEVDDETLAPATLEGYEALLRRGHVDGAAKMRRLAASKHVPLPTDVMPLAQRPKSTGKKF